MTPNQTESEFYTGIPVNDEESAQKAADALRAKGVGDIIMTMGSKGSMGFTSEGTFFTPSRKVVAVDTTAAGDTFCGGLAVALSEGKNLKEAAEFATAASALTVQKMGAQESIPYRNNL
jgi:ribokinase